jgi:hypothetical protein
MNLEASQDGSQRGQLMFRRTSVACNLLSDKLRDVRINSENSSSQQGLAAPMSQDGMQQQQHQQQQHSNSHSQAHHHGSLSQQGPPARQTSQQLRERLTIDTTRYPSQSEMAW